MKIFFVLMILVSFLDCQNSADLAIINAKVWTVDDSQTLADAVAVKGDKIQKVGFREDIENLIGQDTKIIDAQGKLVLPGFNDAHLHFIGGGLALMNVDLNGCKTVEEIQGRIKQRVNEVPKGSWITGRGWDHTLFNNGDWPTKEMLDAVSPDNPVFVRRVDGHVGWANSVALKEANVTAESTSPEGGEIVKDRSGEPTGVFKETATGLVSSVIPETTAGQEIVAIEKAIQLAKELGITSIQDNSGIEKIEMYNGFFEKELLTVRVSEWMNFDLAKEPEKLKNTFDQYKEFEKENYLRLGLLKGLADGTLGSRTAWFFEPYADDPSTTGLPQYDENELIQMICTADSLGFQVGLHCIGAKANWAALEGFKEARKRFGTRDSRHRLEHAQVFRLQDIPMLNENGVIASMQPTHCTSDMR